MAIRRILAAVVEGRSTIIADDTSISNPFNAVPGFDVANLWEHAPGKQVAVDGRPLPGASILPQAGGATFCIVTFPPDSVMQSATFDPQAAACEYQEKLPGFAETFDPDGSGMHLTQTTDFGVVISGNPTCVFDSGEVELHPGDVVIQQKTHHAWRNPHNTPAVIAFVLIDSA